MTAATEGVRARGVGARLRSARERAGLSTLEAAESLHLEPGTLEALEAERFEQLGAPVYARGYIGHYAELVGESAAELRGLYAASAHAARLPDLTRFPSIERARASSPLLVPGIVVFVAVAVTGTAWWISGNLSGATPVRAASSLTLGAAQGGTLAGGAPVPGGAAAQAPLADAGVADAAPAPQSEIEAVGPQPILDDFGPPAPAQLGLRAPARVAALEMRFTEDSWTEVYDARGQRLFYDVGFAGSTRTVRGMPPLRVVLGNPPEVALALDGHTVEVPQAPRNVVVEFRINRSGQIAPMRLAAADRRGSEDRKPAGPRELN